MSSAQFQLEGSARDLDRVANNLSDPNGLAADACAEICADVAMELREHARLMTELVEFARRVAQHFDSLDAPLGVTACALLARARGE